MFSPFHDQLLASSSEDGKCKIWMIPDGGLVSHVMKEDMALLGHSKKVLSLRWHNSVENLLASASIDNTIKIWDVNEGKAAYSFNFANSATSMQWKPDGKILGTMIKGSQMAFFDPRAESSVWQQASHEGTKAQKMQWISDVIVVTAGFNKMNEREFALWDIRQQGASPIATGELPDGSGTPHIYFDREHGLLYNSGRGDGSIQFFQYSESIPGMVAFLGKFSHGQACKSFSILPKQSLDPTKHEVGRSVRYLADNTLDYIAFRNPNRTGDFQEDLYPPFPANKPSNDIASWMAGTDKPVKTMQLRPGE